MPKPDTASGLLSRMVKFVRNPATSWSELDTKEPDRDEAVSKQLLKEMLDRKRRNDFVRKREFDMLRKMRKRDAMVGQELSAGPSFFHSSLPSTPDDRASTLKKIDEIEAQMSMQWWKTNHGNLSIDPINKSALPGVNPAMTQPAPRTQPPSSQALPTGYAATESAKLQPRAELEPNRLSAAPNANGERRTGSTPLGAAPHRPMVVNAPVRAAMIGGLSGVGVSDDNTPSGFSPSRMVAMDVFEVAHDAELEEASIRFANGDDAGAEGGLMEMLTPNGSRAGNSETWLALFDLYRATGQRDKFDDAATGFVELFHRSPPQWFSMPDMLTKLVPLEIAADNGSVVDWVCPAAFGVQSVGALNAALAKAPMPWRLDWRNLKTIDAAAVEPLFKVFNSWSEQPVQLRFIGGTQLHELLQKATPSGQQDVSQALWQLRMEALRVTHRADEFELAALDFCVTFEVSPPAWESAQCDYKSLDQDGGEASGYTVIGEVCRDSETSSVNATEGESQMHANVFSVELSGLIQGDAIAVLDQLEAKLIGADVMHISCARLIRVDFSAAGTLLNWVCARQAESRSVQFSDVNRLVAAFFNVIGITEYARVITRVD